MDIYTQAIALISGLPTVQNWPEMLTLFKRAAAAKPQSWNLPLLACTAIGGTSEQAMPAVAAVACLQISIILIDDLLDDDPRGEYRRIGAPATANLAAAFQAAGLEAISQSAAEPAAKLAALTSLNQMVLTTALGQHWDAQNPADETSYWRLVQTKSSPYFGAAMHSGALMGGAGDDVAAQLKQIGLLYGEMIQIHDDLNDAMAVPANPDWTLGRSPLPILYAQLVDHRDRIRFLELRQVIGDPGALTEAQNILIRCGAVSYCVDQLLRRYQAAQAMLAVIPLVGRAGLDDLMADQIKPVQALFEAMGIPLVELMPVGV